MIKNIGIQLDAAIVTCVLEVRDEVPGGSEREFGLHAVGEEERDAYQEDITIAVQDVTTKNIWIKKINDEILKVNDLVTDLVNPKSFDLEDEI